MLAVWNVADIDIAGVLALGLPAALPADAPPVLWWSGHDARYRVPAAQAGGAGFVSKRDGLDELVASKLLGKSELRHATGDPQPDTAL